MTKPSPTFWDDRYADGDYVYGTEPNTFVRDHADRIPPGGRVLCLGAGEGRNAVYLATLGYDVVAVDGSKEGGRKTRELAAKRGVTVETVTADLASFEIPAETYDGVTSIFCHLPPAIRAPLHAKVVRGLAPGGALLLEAYTPEQLGRGTGGPPVSEMLYALDALRADFEGLAFEHAEELERDVLEGRFHTGRAAVVQVVARK